MKTPSSDPVYLEFLKIWQNKSSLNQKIDLTDFIKSNPILENALTNGPSIFYMINYQTMNYVYMSQSIKNILGYKLDEVLPIGPQFLYQLIHPVDLKELMNDTFKKIISYIHDTKIEDRKKIRCSYDYRIKRADGKYIRVLQQNVIAELDIEGNPLLDIGIVSEITNYKKDNVISLSLTTYDETICIENESISLKNKKDRISERELEILKLLMKGNSSKQIADELHISSNTVRNHRQNLLVKTNTKNIAELITYAMSNSLI